MLGYAEADNAEINPGCDMPLIAGLQCKLVEKSDLIRITPGSRLSSYCGPDVVEEKYNCGFGINPEYLRLFDGSELRFSGSDQTEEPRALEIKNRTFFIGVAFQPERTALNDTSHPLVKGFLEAVNSNSTQLLTANIGLKNV